TPGGIPHAAETRSARGQQVDGVAVPGDLLAGVVGVLRVRIGENGVDAFFCRSDVGRQNFDIGGLRSEKSNPSAA
ncbi:MAG: hypothetical protein WAW17_09315, partial [Rhodococcus sp. (in: high G+C Gram-positive bacteria)]|uniref:hypothetical protein n=1 Tax=Rhodococcus sp. TaxID=1831 RepID=UPI003BB1C1FC